MKLSDRMSNMNIRMSNLDSKIINMEKCQNDIKQTKILC